MFVSSYNTYIHTNTTNKTDKSKDTGVSDSKSFESKLLHTSQVARTQAKNTPINYIENSKVFKNRQKLQQNIESKNELTKVNKFNAFSSVKTAKVAYTNNSTIFSIVAKPKPTLAVTQTSARVDEFSEQKAKFNAINTYLRNDIYYQITG